MVHHSLSFNTRLPQNAIHHPGDEKPRHLLRAGGGHPPPATSKFQSAPMKWVLRAPATSNIRARSHEMGPAFSCMKGIQCHLAPQHTLCMLPCAENFALFQVCTCSLHDLSCRAPLVNGDLPPRCTKEHYFSYNASFNPGCIAARAAQFSRV